MNNKKIVGIIPARMSASRFPGKPLAKIMDLPMVEHVRRRVCLSQAVDEVYVATCDEVIKEAVESYGGKVVMTSASHERCTDRVNEAAGNIQADIIVIIQGDEPLFFPEVIDGLVSPITADKNIECTNLLSVIEDETDLQDVDVVKAVIDNEGYLMYYSRSVIPFFRVKESYPAYRQTGISAFTKKFLDVFSNLPQTSKERVESVDFLRILDHGYKILSSIYTQRTVGVDRQSDIKEVEGILRNDPVQQSFYRKIAEMV